MTTYRYIVFDALETLKKLEATSDLTEQHVFYWVVTIANRLRGQHIPKTKTGCYLDIFDNVPVVTTTVSTNPNIIKNRQHIVLPKSIYDFIHEQGVQYICRSQRSTCPPEFTFNFFQPTTPAKAWRLYQSPYEQPSLTEPYFYRVHDKIYFLGTEKTNIDVVEIGIYSTINSRSNLLTMDDECDLNDEALAQLRIELAGLGRWMMSIPQDRANDGADTAAIQASKSDTLNNQQE